MQGGGLGGGERARDIFFGRCSSKPGKQMTVDSRYETRAQKCQHQNDLDSWTNDVKSLGFRV